LSGQEFSWKSADGPPAGRGRADPDAPPLSKSICRFTFGFVRDPQFESQTIWSGRDQPSVAYDEKALTMTSSSLGCEGEG
jgi:hypothetical protein